MIAYLLLVSAIGQVAAANIRPQIGYIYPPAGKAGTTIEVQLGTYDWTTDMQLLPQNAAVKFEITGPASEAFLTPPPYWFGNKAGQAQPPLSREVPAKITLPADLPPGEILWRVANANGGSNIGKFVVSELPETVEPEQREASIELPPLPSAVSGRLSRITEIDEYRFTTPTGTQITCRLDDRLGQPFFGVLTIKDSAGRVVAEGADTVGAGVSLRFVSQAGMTYTAAVRDAEFAGDRGYIYRLAIRTAPEILHALPLVVKRGERQSMKFVGWGVMKPGELAAITQDVTPTTDIALREQRIEITTPLGPAVAKIQLGEVTDSLEPASEDINQRQLALPAAVSASFDKIEASSGMPVDRYRFAAKKDQLIRIAAEVDRFQSAVDPMLTIVSSEGKELQRNDDQPEANDAVIDFKVPADGSYNVIVGDVSGLEPTAASVYRLTLEDAAALFDFAVSLPEKLDMAIGGKADLAVKVSRRGSWKAAITLKLEGLPDGVTPAEVKAPAIANTIPADQAALNITLNVAETSAATANYLTVVATTTVGDKTIERRSAPLLLTTTIKTRVKVKSTVQDGGRLVNRGTTYPADVVVERLDGYAGPVTVQMAASQQRQRRGIRGGTLEVPAGVDQVQYPIFMPEWLETSLTARMNLIGVTPVADGKGTVRQVTGIMDGFIVMSLEGALLKITHEPQEYVASPGSTLEIPLRVSRTAKLPVPADVLLMNASDNSAKLTAESLHLAPGESQGTLKLMIAADTKPGIYQVVIRATAMQEGKWPAVSETVVPVHVEETGK